STILFPLIYYSFQLLAPWIPFLLVIQFMKSISLAVPVKSSPKLANSCHLFLDPEWRTTLLLDSRFQLCQDFRFLSFSIHSLRMAILRSIPWRGQHWRAFLSRLSGRIMLKSRIMNSVRVGVC